MSLHWNSNIFVSRHVLYSNSCFLSGILQVSSWRICAHSLVAIMSHFAFLFLCELLLDVLYCYVLYCFHCILSSFFAFLFFCFLLISAIVLCFCLRRSPDHGTVEVVVVVVVVVTIFNFNFFFEIEQIL